LRVWGMAISRRLAYLPDYGAIDPIQ
jgi:hypothetical protein